MSITVLSHLNYEGRSLCIFIATYGRVKITNVLQANYKRIALNIVNGMHIIIVDIHPLYGIANYMLCKNHYGNELIVQHTCVSDKSCLRVWDSVRRHPAGC